MGKELEIVDEDEVSKEQETNLDDVESDDGELEYNFVEDEDSVEEKKDDSKSESVKKESDTVDFDIPDFEYTPEKEQRVEREPERKPVQQQPQEDEIDWRLAYARAEHRNKENEIRIKEDELQRAIDEGDRVLERRVQKELDALEADRDLLANAMNEKPQQRKQEPVRQQQQEQQPQLNPVQNAWVQRNASWFGVKGYEKQTERAIEVYQKLLDDGLRDDHPNTFKRLTEELKGGLAKKEQPADKKASSTLPVNNRGGDAGQKKTVQISRKDMINMGFNPESEEHRREYAKMIQRINKNS